METPSIKGFLRSGKFLLIGNCGCQPPHRQVLHKCTAALGALAQALRAGHLALHPQTQTLPLGSGYSFGQNAETLPGRRDPPSFTSSLGQHLAQAPGRPGPIHQPSPPPAQRLWSGKPSLEGGLCSRRSQGSLSAQTPPPKQPRRLPSGLRLSQATRGKKEPKSRSMAFGTF